MHELAGTQRILHLAEQQAREAGARQITDLYLVVGELSTFTEESVRFYWEMLCPGTLAAGASLHFRCEPAAWECPDCARGRGAGLVECCPDCGGSQLRVTAGQDFFLEGVGLHTGSEAVRARLARVTQ